MPQAGHGAAPGEKGGFQTEKHSSGRAAVPLKCSLHMLLLSAKGWCSLTPIIAFVKSPVLSYHGNLRKIFALFLANIGPDMFGLIQSTIQTDDPKSAIFCDQGSS